MYLAKGRKPISVVAAEVSVETQVRVYAEEFSHDLHGQDLAVRELGLGTALARILLSFESVVGKAENGNDEGAKVHSLTS